MLKQIFCYILHNEEINKKCVEQPALDYYSSVSLETIGQAMWSEEHRKSNRETEREEERKHYLLEIFTLLYLLC